MSKKISVIVPVYNVEKYLEKCIDSIINQEYKNIEIILVNDGSTDKSIDICKKYKNIDDRIVLIDKKNAGVSSSRNLGISLAKGDFIAFIDPDDWIEKDMLFNMYKKCNQGNFDMCICNYVIEYENFYKKIDMKVPFSKKIFNDKSDIMKYIIASLISSETLNQDEGFMMGSICRILVKSSIIKENNILFDENITYSEDLLFLLKILLNTERLCIDDKTYYHYFQRENSAVNSYRKTYYDDVMKVYNKINEILSQEENTEDIIYQRMDNAYYRYSMASILNEFRNPYKFSYKEKIIMIKKVCYDKNIHRILNKLNLNGFSTKKKFIIYCIRKKYIFFIYIYYSITKYLISKGKV